MDLQQLKRGVELQKELKKLGESLKIVKAAVKQELEGFRISTTSYNVLSDGIPIDIYKKTLQITLNMIVIDLEKQIKKLETEFNNL